MLNLLDKFTGSTKSFVVKEEHLLKIIKLFREIQIDQIELSGYRFEKSNDLWLINATITKNQWISLLKSFVDKKYRLVIKNEEDIMYVEQI